MFFLIDITAIFSALAQPFASAVGACSSINHMTQEGKLRRAEMEHRKAEAAYRKEIDG